MVYNSLVRHNALVQRLKGRGTLSVLYAPRRPVVSGALSSPPAVEQANRAIQATWQSTAVDPVDSLPAVSIGDPKPIFTEPPSMEDAEDHAERPVAGALQAQGGRHTTYARPGGSVAEGRPSEAGSYDQDPTWPHLQAIWQLHHEKTRSHSSQVETWSETGTQVNEDAVTTSPAAASPRNIIDPYGVAAIDSQVESSKARIPARNSLVPDNQVASRSVSARDTDVDTQAADLQDREVEPAASNMPIQDAGSSAVQRAPLQQAWPVDRRRETEFRMPQQGMPAPESDPESIRLSSVSDDASIRRALRDVPAGRRTASTVELVLPRKARPRVIKERAAARSLNESAESVDDSPPKPPTVAMGEEEADLMPLRVADASSTLPASLEEDLATVRDEERGLEPNITHQIVSLEANIESKADGRTLSRLEADASLPLTSATLDNLSDEIAHAIESGEYSDGLSSSTEQQSLQGAHDRHVESTDIKRDEEVSPLLERVARIPLRVDAAGDPPGRAVGDAQEAVQDHEPPARIPAQWLTVDESSYDGSMVATDIGLLPRDLWEALGEDPPRSSYNPKRSRSSGSDVERARVREIKEVFEGTTQIESTTALIQEPSLSAIEKTRFPKGAEDVSSPTRPTMESSVDKTPTESDEGPTPDSAIANAPMQALREDMVAALESTTDNVRNLDVAIVPSAQGSLGGWAALRNRESESLSATMPQEDKAATGVIGVEPKPAAVADEEGFDPTLQLSSASRHTRAATSERSSSGGDNDLADPPARLDSVGHVVMDRTECAGGAHVKPTSVNIPAIVGSSASDSFVVQRDSKRSTELPSDSEPLRVSSMRTDLDVDELARQVLVEIKKRLSIERERRPSRF